MVENASLSRSAFLTSSAVTYGYSPYFKKLGKWCSRTNFTNESGFSSNPPGSFEIGEHRVYAALAEQLHGVLGVFVEVGVEDALVLKGQAVADIEEHPAEVVQA